MDKNISKLLDTVVANDYCIGCGICASLEGSPLSMKMDENGKYKPYINQSHQTEDLKINALKVCPFSNENKNETQIGKEIFGGTKNVKFDEFSGYSLKSYAGYVKEGTYREKGSSGGMGNWIAAQLLNNNLVDGIIHIKSSKEHEGILFDYQISYNEEDLFSGAKSKYYPIELSEVINIVKQKKERYAVIGIPCYIKSLRLLADHDEVVRNQIKFFIGLVCGHLKSDMFAKSIGWQLGIKPENLEEIDFRKKIVGKAANDYGVEVKGLKAGVKSTLSSRTKDMYTTNWGHGLFKYNACEFCDDVLAETADVTVGDAWLPEYSHDGMGTNVITVRNEEILKLIENNNNKLFLEEISSDKVYQSQAGGFRHRREGLSYRLYLTDKEQTWRPIKRVIPKKNIGKKRATVYSKRLQLSKESFNAYKIAEREQNFNAFIEYMEPYINEYNKIAKPSVVKRVVGKIKKEAIQFNKKIK